MARILVVDDDPDILRLAEEILNSLNHVVTTAADGWKAMELLDSMRFDLVVSDANMPHFSGFELVQTVRRQAHYKDLPIAMLTGLRERKDVKKAIDAGVDDYIVKPIDPLLFVEKVDALLKKKPPQDFPEFMLSGPMRTEARLSHNIELLSVSELGVKIFTKMPLEVGTMLDLQAKFFTEIEANPPPLKVVACQATAGGHWSQLVFLGAKESLLKKIRAWILSHPSGNKESA